MICCYIARTSSWEVAVRRVIDSIPLKCVAKQRMKEGMKEGSFTGQLCPLGQHTLKIILLKQPFISHEFG